jgi:predicted DCC family thiol-disulfide oxidoreductase YuxK
MLPSKSQTESAEFVLEVFFDGDCPLCRREMNLLKRWDRRLRLRMTDISDRAFDPQAIGKTYAELMARMHGRLPDGTWVEGVEVFRRLYAALGFGPLVVLTRLPVVSQLLEMGYAFFARHRLRLTGRCTPDSCAVRRL